MSTILAWNNLVESATLTAGSADGSYPVTNIQKIPTTSEWRTASGTTTSNVVIDLGSAQTVEHMFLIGSALEGLNFTSITLEANTSDSWGAPAYSSGAITSFPENLLYLATGTQSYRYWRVVITNGAGGATFTGFSNLFLGEALSLTNNNIDTSWSLSQNERADVSTGLYGQRFITTYNKQNEFKGLSFQLLTKDELDTVEAMFENRGVDKPIFFMLDSSEGLINTKEKLAGYFWIDGRPDTVHEVYGLFAQEFSLTQVI